VYDQVVYQEPGQPAQFVEGVGVQGGFPVPSGHEASYVRIKGVRWRTTREDIGRGSSLVGPATESPRAIPRGAGPWSGVDRSASRGDRWCDTPHRGSGGNIPRRLRVNPARHGVGPRPAPRHLLRRRATIGPHGPEPDPLAGDVEPEAPRAAVDGQPAARAVAAGGPVPERQGDTMRLGRRAIGVERPATSGIGARHDPA
jgi:hypothetical protein